MKLDLSRQNLEVLPDIPPGVTELHCYSNNLTSLPPLPTGLTVLDCYMNKLTSLPSLPETLKKLVCSMNKLTILPSLPNELTDLICEMKELSTLPPLPESLKRLECSDNQLTTLELPPRLAMLFCKNNQITTLDLPPELILLNCGGPLTVLPRLPDTLQELVCTDATITAFTNFPENIIHVSFHDSTLQNPFNTYLQEWRCLKDNKRMNRQIERYNGVQRAGRKKQRRTRKRYGFLTSQIFISLSYKSFALIKSGHLYVQTNPWKGCRICMSSMGRQKPQLTKR